MHRSNEIFSNNFFFFPEQINLKHFSSLLNFIAFVTVTHRISFFSFFVFVLGYLWKEKVVFFFVRGGSAMRRFKWHPTLTRLVQIFDPPLCVYTVVYLSYIQYIYRNFQYLILFSTFVSFYIKIYIF